MPDWWTSLGGGAQFFYVVAGVGSAALLVQLILQLFGFAGHDLHLGDADAGGAGDHNAGFGYLSVRTIIAFLVCFGWTGAVAMGAGAGILVAGAVAIAVGAVGMFSIVWLMRALMNLHSSGTLDYRNAIGTNGRVYIPIPAAHATGGQVEIHVQGRVCVAAAVTPGPALPAQRLVKVTGLADPTTLIVEPL